MVYGEMASSDVQKYEKKNSFSIGLVSITQPCRDAVKVKLTGVPSMFPLLPHIDLLLPSLARRTYTVELATKIHFSLFEVLV